MTFHMIKFTNIYIRKLVVSDFSSFVVNEGDEHMRWRWKIQVSNLISKAIQTRMQINHNFF